MKTLESSFFSSKKINSQTIYGGKLAHYENTCLYCNQDGHGVHDGDQNDCQGHSV